VIYEICGHTEAGPVRERNEDHILIGSWIRNRGWLCLALSAADEQIDRAGLLLAVADGIGGLAGGATASRIALDALVTSLLRTTPATGSAAIQAADLEAAMQQVNAAVHEAQATHAEDAAMGTTLSAVLLTAADHWVLHVGDSRVLRIRNGFVKVLTRDDTLAEQLYQAGMDKTIADANPDGGTLVNWIGSTRMQANIRTVPALEAGDQLVICSDGLHGFLSEDAIVASLQDPCRPLRDAIAAMIDAALAAGSTDNVSLLVLRVSDEGSAPTADTEDTHGHA